MNASDRFKTTRDSLQNVLDCKVRRAFIDISTGRPSALLQNVTRYFVSVEKAGLFIGKALATSL